MKTLWTDDAAKRFYLVPDEAKVPEGEVRLRSGASRFIQANPDALVPYEVSRDEARAFLDTRFGEYVSGVKESLHSFFSHLGEAGATAAPPAAPPEPPSPAGPGTTLFATLSGVPEAELRQGPEGFARGVRRMLGEEGSGEVRSEAEERELREGAERLQALSSEVDRAAAEAAARLRSLMESLERLGKKR